MIDNKWWSQYMQHVAANVLNKEGNMRFSYAILRRALDAMEHGNDSEVPASVLQLFANIVHALPPVELSDRQQVVLLLALLNCHMAYFLLNNYLLDSDPSIQAE